MHPRYTTILAFALLTTLGQAEDKLATKGKIVTNSLGMKLKLIKAGTFLMGSPASDSNALDSEKPQHRVRISRDFYLGVTEVTQGQWEAVMGTRPWKDKRYVKEAANFPAIYVSWDDAVAFCKRLGEKEKVTYRLPTEAEWEYACRAGTTTRFSFGDDEKKLGDYAWSLENTKKGRSAHQVHRKRPNPWCLYDMHGNVGEWCLDSLALYKSSAAVDPVVGPRQGRGRVIRGGSWNSDGRFACSADRAVDEPGSRNAAIGFRCARVPLAKPVKKPASGAQSESQ